MLLDPATLDLAPAAARGMEPSAGDPRFRRELPAAQIEIVTGAVRDARRGGRRARRAPARRSRAAHGGWLRLAGAGDAPVRAAGHGDEPRASATSAIVAEYGWAAAAARLRPARPRRRARGRPGAGGLQRAALPPARGRRARRQLARSSAARDTGLASVRPKIAECFPRQGMPPAIPSLRGFAELLDWGARAGAFPDADELWWEARLHPALRHASRSAAPTSRPPCADSAGDGRVRPGARAPGCASATTPARRCPPRTAPGSRRTAGARCATAWTARSPTSTRASPSRPASASRPCSTTSRRPPTASARQPASPRPSASCAPTAPSASARSRPQEGLEGLVRRLADAYVPDEP